MTEEQAILATIISEPMNDLPRLVYADWLEERGFLPRAEFIRLQIDLIEQRRVADGHCDDVSYRVNERIDNKLEPRVRQLISDHWVDWSRHNLPRLGWHCGNIDTKLHEHAAPAFWFSRGFVGLVRCKLADWIGEPCPECPDIERCRQLMTRGDPLRNIPPIPHCEDCGCTGRRNAHGQSIVKLNPIYKVAVTDRDPQPHHHNGGPVVEFFWERDMSDVLPTWRPTAPFVMNQNDLLPGFIFDMLERGLNWGEYVRIKKSSRRLYNTAAAAHDDLGAALLTWATNTARIRWPKGA